MKYKRSINGQFCCKIKNGCLYGFKGGVVRATKRNGKGRRMVSFHKTLFGTVSEKDLTKLTRGQVNRYLQQA